MPSQLHHLLLLSLLFSTITTTLLALPEPEPEPEPVEPSLALPATFTPPATIPAFPEQSDAASACALDLSSDLLHGVSAACSGGTHANLRSRCCPTLAAWLYSAYSAAALTGAGHPLLPAAAEADLPVMPDDSETCVAGAEEALRARGAALPPRVNATCGVAYCYCGVRLLRLACPGPFGTSDEGRWAPRAADGRRMERDCGKQGVAGCSRCLRTLNQENHVSKLIQTSPFQTASGLLFKSSKGKYATMQLKSRHGGKLRNVTGTDIKAINMNGSDRECELMGLSWLLSVNRTRYLPTATAILRAFMEVGDSSAAPVTCALSSDDLPLAVGSSQIEGDSSSSAVTLQLFSPSSLFLYLLILPIVV